MWVLVAVLSVGIVSLALGRTCVFEHFTSTTCPPCEPAESYIEEVEAEYTDSELVIIDYHVNWPAPGDDPYYFAEISDRVSDYGVTGVPSFWASAHHIDQTDPSISTWGDLQDAIRDTINAALAMSSPITLSLTVTTDSIFATINVTTATSGSNWSLILALTENDLYYPDAPYCGPDFNYVYRGAFPSITGTAVDLSSVGEQFVTMGYSLPSRVDNPANLSIVAFVQDRTTHEILEATKAVVSPPPYVFSIEAENATLSLPADSSAETHFYLTNIGTSSDSYEIRVLASAPSEWTASYCSESGCYSIAAVCTLSLASSEVETLHIDVAFTGTAGTGTYTMVATSLGSYTSDSAATEIHAYNLSGDVLLVADEAVFGGDDIDYSSYYIDALEHNGYTYTILDRDDGPVTAAQMAAFNAVIWYTGDYYNAILDSTDRTEINAYYALGGHLLISSPELAWDMIGNLRLSDEYEAMFHNTYDPDVDDEASVFAIHGEAGSDYEGISSSLEGGTGADNTHYPDIMHPIAPAVPILYYDLTGTAEIAAIAYDESYQLAYLAFSFESIADEDTRFDLMDRLLNWLHAGVWEAKNDHPEIFALKANFPNPFNPATTIEYQLPATTSVRLEITNILGQRVALLLNDKQNGGIHRIIWDGKNEKGQDVPSGVYLAKLSSGDKTSIRSMVLGK